MSVYRTYNDRNLLQPFDLDFIFFLDIYYTYSITLKPSNVTMHVYYDLTLKHDKYFIPMFMSIIMLIVFYESFHG